MIDQENTTNQPKKDSGEQTFNLEEIVVWTNEAQKAGTEQSELSMPEVKEESKVAENQEKTTTNENIEEQKELSNSEIVSKMQWGSSNYSQDAPFMPDDMKDKSKSTSMENLDTVIPVEEKTEDRPEVNETTKPEEKKTETVDDVLREEKTDKKSKGWLPALIIIALLALGLLRLFRDGNHSLRNIFSGSGSNNTSNILESTGDTKITKINTEEDKTTRLSNKGREDLGGEYRYNTKDQKIYYKDDPLNNADKASFSVLWKEYAEDKNTVYYKGIAMTNVETDKFKVIDQKGDHKLTGIIVNSKNLLKHLEVKKNREFLMTTIASITNKNQNVKDELKESSIYAMNSFKDDFDELNELQRWDDMTDVQRAKFWVIFLYIKIIKSLESDQIRMSKAKEELRYFIEHSDEILKEYWAEEQQKTSLQGDIGYDQYCVYLDGELFACFLNEIFIKAQD